MTQAAARMHVALFLIASLAVGGCAATGSGQKRAPEPGIRGVPQAAPAPRAAVDPARLAASTALAQVGTPYRYGGSAVTGFDCSGLVHYAYGQAGIRTPRTTAALWRRLTPVAARDLAVGDVLFFDIEGKIGHVGLYLGGGRFVHAPASGRHVTVARLDDPFYRQALVRGGRL